MTHYRRLHKILTWSVGLSSCRCFENETSWIPQKWHISICRCFFLVCDGSCSCWWSQDVGNRTTIHVWQPISERLRLSLGPVHFISFAFSWHSPETFRCCTDTFLSISQKMIDRSGWRWTVFRMWCRCCLNSLYFWRKQRSKCLTS